MNWYECCCDGMLINLTYVATVSRTDTTLILGDEKGGEWLDEFDSEEECTKAYTKLRNRLVSK